MAGAPALRLVPFCALQHSGKEWSQMLKAEERKLKKGSSRRVYYKELLERFMTHKLAVVSVFILVAEILLVVFLPMIMEIDPYGFDFAAGVYARPSAAHILGTDSVGHDVFARLIYGGRISLTIGIISALFSMVIGIPAGLLAGFFRGPVEAVIMRLVDVFMSFPSILLVLVLVSAFGQSVLNIALVIGFMGWTSFARLIHGKVLSVRESEYVEAARSNGVSDFQIMTKYLLPNSFAPCLISLTFRTASAILTDASLSFLGYGVKLPQASWGNLIYEAQSITIMSTCPWIWIAPGLAIIITWTTRSVAENLSSIN